MTDKRPRDLNQLAASIVADAVGEERTGPVEKNRELQEAGRRGGKIGGKRRAQNLSEEELSEIGKKGAKARWS